MIKDAISPLVWENIRFEFFFFFLIFDRLDFYKILASLSTQFKIKYHFYENFKTVPITIQK